MLMKNQADKILPGGKKFSGKDKTFLGYNLYIMNESTMQELVCNLVNIS